MSAATLADLLARGLPHGLATRAQALLQLQDALDRALPAALTGQVRVRGLEAGVLALACASGAVAGRLRQQADALATRLETRGVHQVRIAVDPDLTARYAPPVEKAGLPPRAIEDLARLNADIEDGPLKDALTRLLRHHA
ncbi:DUF721 domain-containing protein [Betaproteobacteria bacterium SCN1]|nr:DUF721 domain-containing protein [Betaproteobacteria bacterium SCN1]MBN8760789.1 DUF721 domain-containing protein [Thiobacillus sp.]ODU90705.1 MAG: hypothetical protein ABT21_01300 [Thiobacillus sp. SCN 65-179]OJW35868.1 MAG: hypothetical protein BGO61_07900 [Thiobacillus sp. 65-69]